METSGEAWTRATSSVIGTVLMVAVVVVLAAVTGVSVFGSADSQSVAPQVSVSHELVDDGAERTVAITLESGDAVRTDRLYVTGSKPLDVGGAPGSGTPANDAFASGREPLSESAGNNPPQVGIGETWDASETVYVDPTGSADGVTVRILWTSGGVRGVNPGTPTGEDTYQVATFTVG
jgi:flagellin-like protein